jgi:hypothetical protein
MFAMNGLEASESEMGIDLRRRYIGVAEHQLNAAKIGAVFNHMRGTAVP